MQTTSALYKQIYDSQNYHVETSIAIGEKGKLITEKAEVILFGGDAILVAQTGADGGYGENMLISVSTQKKCFKGNSPEIGCCVCGEIDIEMYMPISNIPTKSMLVPYVRLTSLDGNQKSEWLKKGVFFIDTRSNTRNRDSIDVLRIHGYDAMMMTEKLYPSSSLEFPAVDIDVINEIADNIGVSVDQRCLQYINQRYMIQYPANYTMREVLGQIGCAYGGNWIMNDLGELQFIPLWALPPETSLLIDHLGYRIVFGQDRILL